MAKLILVPVGLFLVVTGHIFQSMERQLFLKGRALHSILNMAVPLQMGLATRSRQEKMYLIYSKDLLGQAVKYQTILFIRQGISNFKARLLQFRQTRH